MNNKVSTKFESGNYIKWNLLAKKLHFLVVYDRMSEKPTERTETLGSNKQES